VWIFGRDAVRSIHPEGMGSFYIIANIHPQWMDVALRREEGGRLPLCLICLSL
jgi:hypothetical protein